MPQMSPSRRSSPSSSARAQRGLSLIGLLFWGGVIAVLAVVAMKVFPTVLEYYTVQKVVDRIAAGNPSTVPQVRQEFERATQVEYSIQSIKSGDLAISKDGNDKVVIEFAYDKEIDLAGPVYLLIKYRGKSR
jgi:Tfp pilus assembly major pilin PilA